MCVDLYTHGDVVSAEVTSSESLRWVEETLIKKSEYQLPAKISLKAKAGEFYNFMPTLSVSEDVCGIKVVSRVQGRVPSLDSQILLYDLATGDLKCIMDGNYITALRTGAVAAHSIKLLAPARVEKVSFIGCGNTGRATAKMLFIDFPGTLNEIGIYAYKGQEEDFKKYLKEVCNVDSSIIKFYNNYSDLVDGSDAVISSATYFENDIVSPECFKPGALLVPIHTRGFTACDLVFDKIFADDISHVEPFMYFSRFKHKLREVSSVLKSGVMTEARQEGDRVIAYNIGLAIHDIKFASEIYKKLKSSASTSYVFSFNPPEEKFWFF